MNCRFIDRLIYRYLLIPITKEASARARERNFKWVYHKEFPLWGRGRDDAMNLTKYFLLNWPMDDTHRSRPTCRRCGILKNISPKKAC